MTPPAPSSPARIAAVVAGLLLMAPVGVVYLASGLVVPWSWLFLLWALYLALLAGAVVLARRRSWWVLAVAPVTAALWFGLVSAGEQLFGWTA